MGRCAPTPARTRRAKRPSTKVAAGLVGVAWVRTWAPTMKSGGAAMVRLTERLRSPERSQLREAVLAGRVGVRNAAVCVQEMDRLTPRLCPEAVPSVWGALIQLGSQFGPREIRAVRPRLLAEYGADGELQHEQDVAARNAALSQPHDAGDGTFEYRLRPDAEGKTVLEAALGPLAAPRPADGVPDARGSDRRRSDALIEIVRRAVACPEGVPTTAKAQVFLRVDLDDLIRKTRCATTIGSADAGMCWRRGRFGGWPATPGSSPSSWALRRTSSTWVGPAARSAAPRSERSGYATAAARCPAVGFPPSGPMPTTSDTGPTGARPTWAMRPSSAGTTTVGFTTTASPPRSTTKDESCGT